MRKLLFTLVVIMAVSFTAQAQLDIGIKAGVTMAELSGNLDENLDNIQESLKTGYQFGAFAAIGDKLYLQPEIMIASKGGKSEFDSPIIDDPLNNGQLVNYEYTTKLTTFDIPILVGYKLIDTELLNVRAMAGPVASFKIKQTNDLVIGGQDTNVGDYFNDDYDLKSAIWGIQAGAGVDVLMFRLDVRYEWGLNNLSDIDNMDVKSHAWLISLGWKII